MNDFVIGFITRNTRSMELFLMSVAQQERPLKKVKDSMTIIQMEMGR